MMTPIPSTHIRGRPLVAKDVLAFQEFMNSDEFARLLGISKRTLFRLRARKAIPEPVEISTNTIRWRTSEVRAYLERLQRRRICRREARGGSEA